MLGKVAGKWGLFDLKGENICPPQYDNVCRTKNQKIWLESEKKWKLNDLTWVQLNNKWGLINNNGNKILAPQFDEYLDFSEGIAAVKLENQWRFINNNGNFISELFFDKVRRFSSGLAWIEVENETGYINKEEGSYVWGPCE